MHNSPPQRITIQQNTPSSVVESLFQRDCTVQLSIGQYTLPALIDTGAAQSCFKLSTLQNVYPEYRKLMRKPTVQFKTASGSDMINSGTLAIVFRLADSRCEIQFNVFKEMTEHIILGRDFLEKYKGKINFSKNSLEFSNTPMLEAAEKVKLKPYQVCLIKSKCCKTTFLPDGLHGTIMPQQKFNGIQVKPTIGTACNNTTPVLVKNNSPYPLTIKAGTA